MRSRNFNTLIKATNLLALFLLNGTADHLWAYENQCTHPSIGTHAKWLIDSKMKHFYLDMDAHMGDIADGEYIEDIDPNALAVLSHFYNPRNSQPLTIPGYGGAALANIVHPEKSIDRGVSRWADAVYEYEHGQKSLAYESLGRSFHLLTQDMTK
jgi:hypothetical protein